MEPLEGQFRRNRSMAYMDIPKLALQASEFPWVVGGGSKPQSVQYVCRPYMVKIVPCFSVCVELDRGSQVYF